MGLRHISTWKASEGAPRGTGKCRCRGWYGQEAEGGLLLARTSFAEARMEPLSPQWVVQCSLGKGGHCFAEVLEWTRSLEFLS